MFQNIDDIKALSHSVTYVNETKRDNWACDAWLFQITRNGNTVTFDYYTGLGHRKAKIKNPHSNPRSVAYHQWNKRFVRPVAPSIVDLIHSLSMDAKAQHMGFSEWCDNYGYDNDSITALNTYRACEDIGKKLSRLFSYAELNAIRELLADY